MSKALLFKDRINQIEVEAIQFTGSNLDALRAFVPPSVRDNRIGQPLGIRSPKGVMVIGQGYWVVRESNEVYFSCKPETFNENYEPVA